MLTLRKFGAVVSAFVAVTLCAAAGFAQQGSGAGAVQGVKEGAAGHAAIIKEQAQKMGRDFLSEDYEALFDSTHPKIFELAGGREQMLTALKLFASDLRAQKIKIVSYEVGEPGEVKSAGSKLVSVVPTEIKMDFPDSVYTQKAFVLAVSEDGGKVWKFIDGAKLNKETLKLLVPEAAEAVALPKVDEPAVEKKP